MENIQNRFDGMGLFITQAHTTKVNLFITDFYLKVELYVKLKVLSDIYCQSFQIKKRNRNCAQKTLLDFHYNQQNLISYSDSITIDSTFAYKKALKQMKISLIFIAISVNRIALILFHSKHVHVSIIVNVNGTCEYIKIEDILCIL